MSANTASPTRARTGSEPAAARRTRRPAATPASRGTDVAASFDGLQHAAGNRAVDALVRTAINAGSSRLTPSLRDEMEARFDHDFEAVRVHTGEQASQAAEALGAKAFTIGHDIVFRAGLFAPQAAAGKRLLAHELAHVVQQSRGGPTPTLDDRSAALEQSACAAAGQLVGGPGAVPVHGASGTGIARDKDEDAKLAAVARERIAAAKSEVDSLDVAAKAGKGPIDEQAKVRAYDAVNSALKHAHASKDKDLIAAADGLKIRYQAVTAPPAGTPPTQSPASDEPMTPAQAHRAVTAQRGFAAGQPLGKDADAQLAQLETDLKAADTEEKRKTIRQQIEALKKRIAISRPTLKDRDALVQQRAGLQKQLDSATEPATRNKLQQQIKGLDEQITAVDAAAAGQAAPAGAYQGGRFGHSGNTNVTIQIVGADGKVIVTVQAQNSPTQHAEEVAIDQLEKHPEKARFAGATMIVSGDQEVCDKRCVPAVQKFAAKHQLKEAVGDTAHAPKLTSTGAVTGTSATAKTTALKTSDPNAVGKLEQAQQKAGQIASGDPVKLEYRRVTIYKAGQVEKPGDVPAAVVVDPHVAATGKPATAVTPQQKGAPATGGPKGTTATPEVGTPPPKVSTATPKVGTTKPGPATHDAPVGAGVTPKSGAGLKPGATPKPSPQTGRATTTRLGPGIGTAVAGDIIAVILTMIINHFLQKYYEKQLAEHAEKKLRDAIEATRPQLEAAVAKRREAIGDAQAEGRIVSLSATYELDWQDGRDPETGISIGQILMAARLVDVQVVFEGEKAKPYYPPRGEGVLGTAGDIAGSMFNQQIGRSLTYEPVEVPLTGTDENVRRFKQIEAELQNAAPGSEQFDKLAREKEELLPHYQAFLDARKQREAEEAARKARRAAAEAAAEEKRKQEKLARARADYAAQQKTAPDTSKLLPPPSQPSAQSTGPSPQATQGPSALGPFGGQREWTPSDTADIFEAQKSELIRLSNEIAKEQSANTLAREKLDRYRARKDAWIGQLKQAIRIFEEKGHGGRPLDRLKAIEDWLNNEGRATLVP